jgi:hypothetical protein
MFHAHITKGERFKIEALLGTGYGQPRSLLEREGRLSGLLIDETDGNGFQFGLSRPGFAA